MPVPRRLNLSALLLSALLVFGGAVAVLRWQPAIPGIGIVREGGETRAGIARRAPPVPGPGCRADRGLPGDGVRFDPACYGHAPSFDRRFYVVKNAGRMTGIGLVRGGSGESLDDLDVFDNGRPFAIFWSPVAHRFAANQDLPDDLALLRLFEVRGARLIADPRLADAAIATMRARRPCLADRAVGVSAARWSTDGRRIVLLAHAREGSCSVRGSGRTLWMIGDVASGRIDPASVRSRAGRDPIPGDGPYATL